MFLIRQNYLPTKAEAKSKQMKTVDSKIPLRAFSEYCIGVKTVQRKHLDTSGKFNRENKILLACKSFTKAKCQCFMFANVLFVFYYNIQVFLKIIKKLK